MASSITKSDFLRVEGKLDIALDELAAHRQTLYGREGTGGLTRQTNEMQKDLTQTKLGAAMGLLMLLAGAIVAKVVGWV